MKESTPFGDIDFEINDHAGLREKIMFLIAKILRLNIIGFYKMEDEKDT